MKHGGEHLGYRSIRRWAIIGLELTMWGCLSESSLRSGGATYQKIWVHHLRSPVWQDKHPAPRLQRMPDQLSRDRGPHQWLPGPSDLPVSANQFRRLAGAHCILPGWPAGGDCSAFSYRYFNAASQASSGSWCDRNLATMLCRFEEGIHAQYRSTFHRCVHLVFKTFSWPITRRPWSSIEKVVTRFSMK